MDWSDLIAAFQDTLKISEGPKLAELTRAAKASTRVYPEGFQTQARLPLEKAARITVEEDTSFAAARRYRAFGRTAVLNFANPVTPGGGVRIGAMAQEECLCRSSNLYLCLTASPFPEYYGYHKTMDDRFYSDRLLYTRDVTVFKDDEAIPRLLPEREWFQTDVITCAAPYLAGRGGADAATLKRVFKGRIKNILEAALDNGAGVVILGAFGCGAFKNPPEIVAAAFREAIEENGYGRKFDRIVFAVKKSADRRNVLAFFKEFSPPEAGCPAPPLP